MRLRKSVSSASGAWKEKGRISSLVAILESPCFDLWLGRAPPCAAKCVGRRLTTLAAAEAARTLRRVVEELVDMTSLLGSNRVWPWRMACISQPPTLKMIGSALETNVHAIAWCRRGRAALARAHAGLPWRGCD